MIEIIVTHNIEPYKIGEIYTVDKDIYSYYDIWVDGKLKTIMKRHCETMNERRIRIISDIIS